MKILNKFLCVLGVCGLVSVADAADLSGTAFVNVTSDTAANAKEMAFDEARRQVILDALTGYADTEQLRQTLKNASGSSLNNLITSTSIDGEKQSDTTYSANITMQLDRDAVKKWLLDNNINNWMLDDVDQDVFVAQVIMSDKLANWMELKRLTRANGIDMAAVYINGNRIMAEVPLDKKNAFTNAVRMYGWHVNNQNGIVSIWK